VFKQNSFGRNKKCASNIKMAAHGSYDSVGNYLAFDPDATFRFWNRYQPPPCIRPGDRPDLLEKRKLAVLGKLKTRVCRDRNKFVQIGKIKYVIDPMIYPALMEYLEMYPVATLDELKAAIEVVRITEMQPAQPQARLQTAPLVGILPARTYSWTGDKMSTAGQTDYLKPKAFTTDFKLGQPLKGFFSFLQIVEAYASNFVDRRAISEHGHFVFVQSDKYCTFENKISEIKETRAGRTILPLRDATWLPSLNIVDSDLLFKPVLTILVPVDNFFTDNDIPVKFGILFGFNSPLIAQLQEPGPILDEIRNQVAANSELIFIPLQREIDVIENKNCLTDTPVRFPVTNGGEFLTSDYDRLFRSFQKRIDERPIRVTQGLYI
jgi:hypothetical protein